MKSDYHLTMEAPFQPSYMIRKAVYLLILINAIPAGFMGICFTLADDTDTNNKDANQQLINACVNEVISLSANESSQIISLQSRNKATPCRVLVIAPPGHHVRFVFDEGTVSTFQYFFVEAQGVLSETSQCHRKYAVFTDSPSYCNVGFVQQQLLINLQGRTTLQMLPTSSNVSCTHTDQCNTTCHGQISSRTCESLTEYHHVSLCTVGHNGQIRLNKVRNITRCPYHCPPSCSCTLSKSEMTAKCSDNSTYKTFIIYPEVPIGLHLGNKRLGVVGLDAFAELDMLQEISLSNNSLSELAPATFRQLRSLLWLDLSGNNLQHLQPGVFTGLGRLDSLNLGRNRFVHLPPGTFSDLPNLNSLVLSNNHLKTLNSGIFYGLQSLNWLNLDGNNLHNLAVGVFDELTSLQTLKLGNNNLTQLRSNLFARLTKLSVLDLQGNQLVKLKPANFQNLERLSFLYLTDNHLNTIHEDTFQNLPSLFSLSLSNNHLESLSSGLFSKLERLMWLHVDGNRLTTINPGSFRGLSNVKILLLQHNNISSLHPNAFKGLRTLQNLNLSHNHLETLPTGAFRDLKKLERIFLNDNNLTVLHDGMFDGLVKLERLYLASNDISGIKPGTFDVLKRLQILYLEDNIIQELQVGVFSSLPNLNIIKLENNHLSSLPSGVFYELYMLHYLNLENNSLERLGPHFVEDCYALETINLIGNPLQWVKAASFHALGNSSQVLVDDHATCCFVEMSNCTAQNQKPVFLTCERLLPKTILRICMWILGLCALCGNAFVLYRRLSQRRDRHKVQSQLIIHLSFSDLLMGAFMLMLTSADMHFGEFFPSHANAWRSGPVCQLGSVLSILSSEASVFFIMLISIDRLLGVSYPFSSFRLDLKSTKIATTILWLTALMLSLMPLFLTRINSDIYDVSEVCIGLPMARKSVTESKNLSVLLSHYYTKRLQVEVEEKLHTEPGMYYSIAIFIGLNLLCFLIVAFCYLQIFITVKRSSRKVGRHREREEEVRMALKMAVLVLTDFCCWMPVIITGILVQADIIEISPVMYAWIVTFVLPINSSVNPFIYTIATVISDRRQRRRKQNIRRQGSIMNYSHDQKTIHKSTTDSGIAQVQYKEHKDISSQVTTTNDTNRTNSTSENMEMLK